MSTIRFSIPNFRNSISMTSTDKNGNPFLKQVSKLFDDLSAGQKEKPPISPRITCTRLRRLQEIKCELLESDLDLNMASQNELEATVAQLNTARTKNESFGSWILRNKQAHQQMANMESQLHFQARTNSLNDKNSKDNAFANFSPTVLQKVAKNPNTPATTLKWLATHHKPEVRRAVATNRNANMEIVLILANDADENVRCYLLDNVALNQDTLVKLCDDLSPLVSEKAKNILYERNKNVDINMSAKSGKYIDYAQINESFIESQAAEPEANFVPTVSADNLAPKSMPALDNGNQEKAELIEREFLQVIAERSTTPPRRLAELAVHPDKIIRGIVAANPNTTPEILWQLAKDESIDVRRKLLGNYNCPEDIINSLMRK